MHFKGKILNISELVIEWNLTFKATYCGYTAIVSDKKWPLIGIFFVTKKDETKYLDVSNEQSKLS